MNFILGLPRTKKDKDIIFVVIEKFSKMSRFIACNRTNEACCELITYWSSKIT